MQSILRRTFWLAALVMTVAAVGCRDAVSPEPETAPSTEDGLLPNPGGILSGNLEVRTSTTGSSLDPNGYTVTVDGYKSRSIGTNGRVTFTGISTGTHSVEISGVAGNCSVDGSSSRTVLIIAQLTARTTFEVRCQATAPETGDLTVTTSTSGSNLDPDGYTVTLDGSTSRSIGTNGSVTFSDLSAGDHRVELSGVAANCAVEEPNLRTVTVPAGGVGSTTFSVTCEAEDGEEGTAVEGLGAMGSGPAEPGGDRQEFDFEATDAPGGRMAVTDYSVVRSDGRVGSMFADPAVDPETGIDSFSRTSATCVRFGGTGRIDTGELWPFFIDACDNASPGPGSDTFTITLPDRSGPGNPFVRSGTLTEGDIVIRTF